MQVDHDVVPGFSGFADEPSPVSPLETRALVPRQNATHEWVGLKHPFHGPSHQDVKKVAGMSLVPCFQSRRGEDHVAQERRLDEQNASRCRHSEKVLQVSSDRDVVLTQGLGQ